MKTPIAGASSQFSADKVQPLLIFLLGLAFVLLGLRIYPAFIAVGSLFLVVGYRGYTCRQRRTTQPPIQSRK